MGVTVMVFVEVRYELPVRKQSADQTAHWSTEVHWSTKIQIMWPRHVELYRLMGRPVNNDDGWVMYPLRGLPSDVSDEAKEYIGAFAQASWLTAQELFYLQEALAYPEQMPSFHATVAFVKEYLKHDTPSGQMRIVYGFNP